MFSLCSCLLPFTLHLSPPFTSTLFRHFSLAIPCTPSSSLDHMTSLLRAFYPCFVVSFPILLFFLFLFVFPFILSSSLRHIFRPLFTFPYPIPFLSLPSWLPASHPCSHYLPLPSVLLCFTSPHLFSSTHGPFSLRCSPFCTPCTFYSACYFYVYGGSASSSFVSTQVRY